MTVFNAHVGRSVFQYDQTDVYFLRYELPAGGAPISVIKRTIVFPHALSTGYGVSAFIPIKDGVAYYNYDYRYGPSALPAARMRAEAVATGALLWDIDTYGEDSAETHWCVCNGYLYRGSGTETRTRSLAAGATVNSATWAGLNMQQAFGDDDASPPMLYTIENHTVIQPFTTYPDGHLALSGTKWGHPNSSTWAAGRVRDGGEMMLAWRDSGAGTQGLRYWADASVPGTYVDVPVSSAVFSEITGRAIYYCRIDWDAENYYIIDSVSLAGGLIPRAYIWRRSDNAYLGYVELQIAGAFDWPDLVSVTFSADEIDPNPYEIPSGAKPVWQPSPMGMMDNHKWGLGV